MKFAGASVGANAINAYPASKEAGPIYCACFAMLVDIKEVFLLHGLTSTTLRKTFNDIEAGRICT